MEFYFPQYSENAAAEALQTILKEPMFDATRKADVARLLRAIKVNVKSRTFGNEIDQLRATIGACVSAEDLRDFLKANKDRYSFYTSRKARKIVDESLHLQEEAEDIVAATAKRLYAIHNRIVHAKGGYGDQEALFPFDAEIKYLPNDIDLAELLARKALIASSRALQA